MLGHFGHWHIEFCFEPGQLIIVLAKVATQHAQFCVASTKVEMLRRSRGRKCMPAGLWHKQAKE